MSGGWPGPDEQPKKKSPAKRAGGCLGDLFDGCSEGCALPVLAVAAGVALVVLARGRRRTRTTAG
jgi:hypothetical protein